MQLVAGDVFMGTVGPYAHASYDRSTDSVGHHLAHLFVGGCGLRVCCLE